VTAVDLSPVATARALARDRGLGVRVAREVGDLADWRPAPGRRFDLAAVLFLHGPPALRGRAIATAAGALAPGGWLLLEGFARDRRGLGAMGPDDPEKRYDLGETLAALDGLDLVEALEGAVALDEGPRHAGVAAVIRVTARRPG
jgi:SAM-dependent methyltransferase